MLRSSRTFSVVWICVYAVQVMHGMRCDGGQEGKAMVLCLPAAHRQAGQLGDAEAHGCDIVALKVQVCQVGKGVHCRRDMANPRFGHGDALHRRAQLLCQLAILSDLYAKSEGLDMSCGWIVLRVWFKHQMDRCRLGMAQPNLPLQSPPYASSAEIQCITISVVAQAATYLVELADGVN